MNRRALVVLAVLTLSMVTVPTVASDRSAMKREAESVATQGQSVITGSLSENNPATDALPSEYTHPPQTRYNAGNMQNAAQTEMQNSEAAQTVNSGFSKRSTYVRENKGHTYLNRAKAAQADPRHIVDTLEGEYSDCDVEEGTAFDEHSLRSCDVYYESSTNSCERPRIVEVDADHHYRCEKTRNSRTYSCTQTLSLSCPGLKAHCDEGALRTRSAPSDLQWTYRYPTLTLGRKSGHEWVGSCRVFDRSATFTVNDVNQFTAFRLVQARYDDYLQIRLNNHLVYNGPYGGRKLEVGNRRDSRGRLTPYVDVGTGRQLRCEVSNRSSYRLSVNLRPYLKNGTNTLRLRVVASGEGDGWVKISTQQQCDCPRWVESWREQCR
jgi:hypothetical protein